MRWLTKAIAVKPVMISIFFLVFLPLGLILRGFGWDPLRLRRRDDLETLSAPQSTLATRADGPGLSAPPAERPQVRSAQIRGAPFALP